MLKVSRISRNASHILNSFLLSRLPLYFLFMILTISLAKVLCTDFCSLHGEKTSILYVMIGFEARCFTAKSGRFVPIAFIPTEVTVHWRTYMSTWAKRAWIWVTGWFLRCSNTYLYKCTCEAPDKVSRPGSYQWHVSTYMHSLHPQNASFMIFNQPTGLRPLSTNQVRFLFFSMMIKQWRSFIHMGMGQSWGMGTPNILWCVLVLYIYIQFYFIELYIIYIYVYIYIHIYIRTYV